MRTFGPSQKGIRKRQVTEVVRNELSMIIQRSVKDPRLGFITITGLTLSDDYRAADVTVSRLIEDIDHEFTPAEQQEVIRGLEQAAPFMYQQLKKRLSMKVIPRLRFTYDDRFHDLSKIWALTADLKVEGAS